MGLRQLTQNTFSALAMHTDRLFVEWVIKGQAPGRPQRPRPSEAEALAFIEAIEQMSDVYAAEEMSDAVLFPEPAVPSEIVEGSGPLWRAAEHITWRSGYEVLHRPLREEYETEANRTVHVHKFGGGGRRAIVCVHGYMGGHIEVESRLWPVRQFLERGFDVFFITLPHHGPRMQERFGKPLFPENARYTVEGMCQSVFDVRTLVSVLRARGYEHVGLVGMSLGGYVVSLCLGVEERIAFGVPLIPLTSFAQMSQDFEALVGEDAAMRARHKRAIASLCSPIDPLARRCLIDPDHVMILAGKFDGVLSPHQSRTLAQHLGCELVHFEGGHLLQRGRRPALDRALDMAQRACA